jgi:hypothetical protein
MNSIDAEQSASNGSPGSWTAAHRTNQTVMMMMMKFGESNFSCSSASAEQESFLSSVCHLWTQLVKLRAFLPSCLYGVCLPMLSYLSHANLCCWLCTPNIAELRSAVESHVQLESCLSVCNAYQLWLRIPWMGLSLSIDTYVTSSRRFLKVFFTACVPKFCWEMSFWVQSWKGEMHHAAFVLNHTSIFSYEACSKM